MTTAAKLIAAARRDIGVREHPSGSNRVKYTQWYGMIGPWCAMAVSYWANRAGIPTSVIPKHAYTPSGKNWFRARKQWGSKPRVGALAYYNLSGLGRVSHVGIVERVYSDGSFDAIEGNTDYRGGRTGGRVMRKRRKALGAGGGFGYPKYGGKAAPVTADLGTKWEKVGYGDILRKGVQGDPVKDVQRVLGIEVDGFYGDDTANAVGKFQQRVGVEADKIVGPQTWAKLKADPKFARVAQKPKPKAKGKVPGPRTPFPLPSGYYFGPKSGGDKSVSGFHSRKFRGIFDRSWLIRFAEQLQRRGWSVGKGKSYLKSGIDGKYGDEYAALVKAFQKDQGLKADGLLGERTWDAAFQNPVK